VRAGPVTGTGWTYAAAAARSVITGVLAGVVTGRNALDVPGACEAMIRAVRNIGRPGIAATAISAVDIALWDLKARLLGCPLARLLGQARDSVPIYGSGGFTSYDARQTRDQLAGWVERDNYSAGGSTARRASMVTSSRSSPPHSSSTTSRTRDTSTAGGSPASAAS
jgi:L-alanine-DL-glutamate epimerase-like enolase superfamily enzyme